MLQGTRTPVPYGELNIGHWYQVRFDFNENEFITHRTSTTTSTASSFRVIPRHKSHWVLVLTKFKTPGSRSVGRAICLFLTSSGGRPAPSTAITSSHHKFKYIPVNSTTPFVNAYRSIPISTSSLFGYLNLASLYELPVGGGSEGSSGDGIVRVCERGRNSVDIWSPGWVVPYLEKLKVAWVSCVLAVEIETKWLEVAEAVTVEFGGGTRGLKRLRDYAEEEENYQKGRTGRAPSKRLRSGLPMFDGAHDDNGQEDSRIHDTDFEMEMEVEGEAEAEAGTETPGKQSCVIHQRSHPPEILSFGFYRMGEGAEDVDIEVDFALLDALFRPFLI